MTPETREALKDFAQGCRTLAGALLPIQAHDMLLDIQRRTDRLIRALEQESVGMESQYCCVLRQETGNMCESDCPSISVRHYEIWRDEQLDTLRKLFRQRGPSEEYKSFPDFCLEQFEGSGKGKVKI